MPANKPDTPPRRSLLRRLIRNQRGATAIEYGLIAALIAVAAIVAIRGLGSQVRGPFNNAASAMSTAAPAG